MGLSVLVTEFSSWFAGEAPLMSRKDLAVTAEVVERISKLIEHAQLVAAKAIDDQNLAACGESETTFTWDVPSGQKSEFRNTADYLRARLGIGKAEAARRLRVAGRVLPRVGISGQRCDGKYADLGAAVAGGLVAGNEAAMISSALDRAALLASGETLEVMEKSLTVLATETDADALGRAIRLWEARLDADGQEPTEDFLKARQGVFLRGRRHGLNRLDIAATDEQFEYLMTVMNTAANPRTKPCDDFSPSEREVDAVADESSGAVNGVSDAALDNRSRAQKHLDGLVGGCQLALATDKLPSTGGLRPQIMVTIDYRDLLNRFKDSPAVPADSGEDLVGQQSNGAAFMYGGPIDAGTVRKIACDADIIPVVLGGRGEVLNLGRARRLFTPKQRKALMARDGGCAFPGCSMPAQWTEAHHVDYWTNERGETDVNRGVLLCSFHHHLIHQGNWTIDLNDGVPWFIPPAYIDVSRRKRRNRFFHPLRRGSMDGTNYTNAQAEPPAQQWEPKNEFPLRAFTVEKNKVTKDQHGQLDETADEFVLPRPTRTGWTASAAGDGDQAAGNHPEPRWIGADGDTEQPTLEELFARHPNPPGTWHTGWI